MPFWCSFPATPYTALMNNIPDMLTRLIDTASRLIYAWAHKIFSVFRKRVPPLTEINEEPQNVSQEFGKNNSTGLLDVDEGGISGLEQMQTFTRSEIQQSTTMENLPNDILLNIFIRLLAKQLSQMRCVSKTWNALLSESSFVKSHLHHSIYNNDRILLVFYCDDDDPEPFSAHPCRSPHLELTNFIKLPLDNLDYKYNISMIEIIGSIHGLICSHYSNDVIHIWNPSLSVVSTLPPHYIPSRGSYFTSLRFGFDPKTEDYKVVKLIGLIRHSEEYVVENWLQVEIYSMRKHYWELINQRFPSHVTKIIDTDYICVDGHDGRRLHWHCNIDEEGELQTIVAFDLVSETFSEIPFPDSLLDGKRSNLLGFLGEKLCVMSWYEGDDKCEVWVMDEYGVAESWIKYLVLSNFLDDLVFGITSHNEFLFVNEDCHLVFYDVTTHKALEKFHLRNYNADKIVEYVDNLIWIAPAEREMINGARQH